MAPSRPLLGLDELKLIVQAISPEYLSSPNAPSIDYFELQPILSKDARATLCTLSLTCRALRSQSQRALMQYLSLQGPSVSEVLSHFTSRYKDSGMVPVRKLQLFGGDAKNETSLVDSMSLLKMSTKLEYLHLSGSNIGDIRWSELFSPIAVTQFKHLVTLVARNRRELMQLETFVSIITVMPCLKHLITSAIYIDSDEIPPEPAFRLEILCLSDDWGSNFAGFEWLISNSFQSIRSMQLSWMDGDDEVMASLRGVLQIVGPGLWALHIWGGDFTATSIASLISLCPNLHDLGFDLFEVIADEEIDEGAENFQLMEEADSGDPTMACINSLRSPLVRLHIIHAYSPAVPIDGLGLPALCRALWRSHEMLSKLDSISLAFNGRGEVNRLSTNMTPECGILRVCKARGIKVYCSSYDDVVEWGWE